MNLTIQIDTCNYYFYPTIVLKGLVVVACPTLAIALHDQVHSDSVRRKKKDDNILSTLFEFLNVFLNKLLQIVPFAAISSLITIYKSIIFLSYNLTKFAEL